jgi:surface protein
MNRIFCGCTSLNSLDISNFNSEKIENMDNIFDGMNKKCKVISNDNNIIIKKLEYFS